MEDSTLYAGTLPTLEMYESIDRLQKPVIASVNGFAVGGGNVLQMVCDLTIAKESAVFRQVGPMMGSFDAGYGTWYLEDLVGKKRAKDIWYRNPKMSAAEALALGLINKVVPDAELAATVKASASHSVLGSRKVRRFTCMPMSTKNTGANSNSNGATKSSMVSPRFDFSK